MPLTAAATGFQPGVIPRQRGVRIPVARHLFFEKCTFIVRVNIHRGADGKDDKDGKPSACSPEKRFHSSLLFPEDYIENMNQSIRKLIFAIYFYIFLITYRNIYCYSRQQRPGNAGKGPLPRIPERRTPGPPGFRIDGTAAVPPEVQNFPFRGNRPAAPWRAYRNTRRGATGHGARPSP